MSRHEIDRSQRSRTKEATQWSGDYRVRKTIDSFMSVAGVICSAIAVGITLHEKRKNASGKNNRISGDITRHPVITSYGSVTGNRRARTK